MPLDMTEILQLCHSYVLNNFFFYFSFPKDIAAHCNEPHKCSCVHPWYLSNAISGSILSPSIVTINNSGPKVKGIVPVHMEI